MIRRLKKKQGRGSRPTKRRAVRRAPARPNLDPDAPGLDEETRMRRRVLAKLRNMTPEELHRSFIHAGIYTEDGQLAEPYRNNEPSACRPTD